MNSKTILLFAILLFAATTVSGRRHRRHHHKRGKHGKHHHRHHGKGGKGHHPRPWDMEYYVAGDSSATCDSVPATLDKNPMKACKTREDEADICLCIKVPEKAQEMMAIADEDNYHYEAYNNATGFIRKCGTCVDPCQNLFWPNMTNMDPMMMKIMMGGGMRKKKWGGRRRGGHRGGHRRGGHGRHGGRRMNAWKHAANGHHRRQRGGGARDAIRMILETVIEMVKDDFEAGRGYDEGYDHDDDGYYEEEDEEDDEMGMMSEELEEELEDIFSMMEDENETDGGYPQAS